MQMVRDDFLHKSEAGNVFFSEKDLRFAVYFNYFYEDY